MPLSYPQLTVILGLLFVIAEIVVGIDTSLDLVVIGSVLVFGGFAGILTNNFLVTLVVSSILSVAYIVFGRRLIKKRLRVLTSKTNVDKLIGQTGITTQAITPNKAGTVMLSDEAWRATSSQTISVNTHVQVEAVEGVSLIVKKITN
jgi:inner membrane protein